MATQSSGTIKLKKPILIEGKEISELTYDVEEIDFELQAKAEAQAKAQMQKSSKGISFSLVENDYTYHYFLGLAAIIGVNPFYEWEELKRIKGSDMRKISAVGRQFFFGADEPEESSSEKPQEPTPDTSTQA